MEYGNLWPEFESFSDFKTPKEILEQQAKFLPKLSGEIIYAEIIDVSYDEYIVGEAEEGEFSYKFVLKSKFMDKYQFEIFTMSHDISIYPVRITLDSSTKQELGITTRYANAATEDQFIKLLSNILHSKRIKTVISSLIKLSK